MKVKAKKHAEFVSDVLSLNKKPELKKASRTEPTLQISEFNLVKSVTGKEGAVSLNDLTKVLKKRAKHVKIGKQVTSANRKAKTLPKPLEKPRAERIRRTVAFENVKKQLDRWDAVVTSNRASSHLNFPLPETNLESAKDFTGFRLKTTLQKELEELEPKVEVFNLEKESEYPLTMQEMMERRKEMAKMRAVQSYKEAKARRQNKIKSKKYHRIQRRDKIKQQMKEFEQLQKSNPAEALKKLEEIERVRVEERASLRHRSTGKWAQNKQVQAKYDKDSRKVLAEQLSLSRDLTQKLKATGGDSESEEDAANDASISKSSKNNPWTNPIKTDSEVEAFLSGYRKFWENENNKTADQLQDSETKQNGNANEGEIEVIRGSGLKTGQRTQQEMIVEGNSKTKTSEYDEKPEEAEMLDQNQSKQKEKLQNSSKILKLHSAENNKTFDNKQKQKKNHGSPKAVKQVNNLHVTKLNKTLGNKEEQEDKANEDNKPEPTKKNKIKDMPHVGTTDWDVTLLSDDDEEEDDEFDNIFDNFDENLQNTLQNKYKKLKKDIEKENKRNKSNQKIKKKSQTQSIKNKTDLSFSLPPTRPVVDEQLLENHDGDNNINKNNLTVLESILKDSSIQEREKQTPNNIDPNDIIKTKPVELNTEIPDLLTLEENEENVDQKGTISEAFQDDDIVDEFKKDKLAEIDGEKPKDINLALPGWGSWGGTGIRPSKRKDKRFIIKLPKKFKRRDDNKGDLIINEKANVKIKSHLVSEVPFPFKKVKDFEASIRAPISNTFVPEIAYRKMIRPAVRTKMGTVIEPMTDDILLKKKK